MMHNTVTLKSAYSLKATVNDEDEIEVPPNQHDNYNRAKLFENTHQEDTQDETYQEDRNRAKNPRDRRNQNTSLALTREQVEDIEKEMFKMIPFATEGDEGITKCPSTWPAHFAAVTTHSFLHQRG